MTNEIPLLDLNAQYETIKPDIKEAVNRVLDSQHFIMGPEVCSFEQEVANYCNTEFAVSCGSGSDALLLSLMALNVGEGDAVITTPYTFFATAGAIARLGATPVFLDIDPVSYNLDPNQLNDFLMEKHPLNQKIDISQFNFKAVIPVHLYGQMANMDSINQIAAIHDIAVIEDAAQAIGSEYKKRRAGSIGDFGCFSFFPSKNLGGYGDGGLITTSNPNIAEKLRLLRLHGAKPKYHHKVVGINSRLDAIQAAILQVKLNYLEIWSEARREKAHTYNKLFEEAGISGSYSELSWSDSTGALNEHPNKLFTPLEIEGDPQQGGRHIYHQYVIRTAVRDKIIEGLDKNSIGHSIYYPVPMHEQECFKYLGYKPSDCSHSSYASQTTLALPIYPELTIVQQEFVVDTIKKALLNDK